MASWSTVTSAPPTSASLHKTPGTRPSPWNQSSRRLLAQQLHTAGVAQPVALPERVGGVLLPAVLGIRRPERRVDPPEASTVCASSRRRLPTQSTCTPRSASPIAARRPAAPVPMTSTPAATRRSPTGVTQPRLSFGCAAPRPSIAAPGQPPQAPLRSSDHRRATILRGLNARTVLDRHLILSRLVDVTDPARVRLRVTQRRILGRVERTVFGIDAGTVVSCVVLGNFEPPGGKRRQR